MLAIGKRTEPKPDLNFQPAWKSFDPVLHFPANISLTSQTEGTVASSVFHRQIQTGFVVAPSSFRAILLA